jgi:putative two-component system protein, hydrogenase maturation factor HypX/HoxX
MSHEFERRAGCLRILFLVSAHNGLSQRAWIELTEVGHDVEVAVVDSAEAMEAAVGEHHPELIVCPFLKKMIPESIWSEYRCLIVHPGPPGDRGPSSLDWAIELGTREWGVTVLEANGRFDAGDVWATRTFPVRAAGKSSLYRHEVRRGAIDALLEAIGQIADGARRPDARGGQAETVNGTARPLMGQDVRAIDWKADRTGVVVRKIRAGEGHPGVLDVIRGTEFHLFGAHPERVLSGRPGEIIAQRNGAICRATVDGGVWITHLKRADTPIERNFKLPATRALELAGVELEAPEIAVALDARWRVDQTYREIVYQQLSGVGYLYFDFYNGAMSSEQCERLREAYLYARSRRDTKVIVLMGGTDYFSNGIHLNVIEAAEDPAEESWRNLNAIDDLAREIIETDSHVVISALGGDAGAGGVMLALAADRVVGREDIVLNPYYQHMGGLFGSEYWTYLLPRRIGVEMTARIVGAPFLPLGARKAVEIGLLDDAFGATLEGFHRQTRELARNLAVDPSIDRQLDGKRRRRAEDESVKPLQAYRDEELARSYECFFGPDPSYHRARQRFAYKLPAPQLTVVRESAGPGVEQAAEQAA